MIHIAFCNRKNFDNPLGGDGIQMLKTKYFLEANHGIKVTIITNAEDLNSSFDLIHIFNYLTVVETENFFLKAKQIGTPIVSSSIYWDYNYSSTHIISKIWGVRRFVDEKKMRRFLKITNFIAKISGRPMGISDKFKRKCAYFIDNSDLILPNSIEEAAKLLAFADRENSKNKIRVILNATDFTNSKIDKKIISFDFHEKFDIPKNYVLQVGRIEYLKNQLNLLLALQENPEIPIVFVGKIVEQRYYDTLQKIADLRSNVFFIPNVSHDEIRLFYENCKAHVLLSLRESPGLVSLEALSLNKPILVSDERFAPVKSYFDTEGVFITNPLDKAEIKQNVLKALSFDDFHNKVKLHNWKMVAADTYNAYIELLETQK